MLKEENIKKAILEVYKDVRFGVLATSGSESPYTCLIGFILSEDLNELYFITSDKTRKYANIENNNRVSILIDNRHLFPEKTYLITAITIMGEAEVLKEIPRSISESYREKHPELTDFSKSANSRMIKVSIFKYIIVNKFQEVIELTL